MGKASFMSTATTQSADDKIGRQDRAALLCCHEPAYAEYLAGELRRMGYKLHVAAGHAEGIARLATRSYHLTVVLENLEGCALGQNTLLQHLAALPAGERRATYVILLCQSFATGDEMAAYALSVDQLINYLDIAQFAALAVPALEEHEEANHHFTTVAARLAA
jgi:ActR/RegA family two-component response regulator